MQNHLHRHRQRSVLAASPGIELDLRGQRAEDALEMLERYLEKAYMAGLPFVRIIHGKGHRETAPGGAGSAQGTPACVFVRGRRGQGRRRRGDGGKAGKRMKSILRVHQ